MNGAEEARLLYQPLSLIEVICHTAVLTFQRDHMLVCTGACVFSLPESQPVVLHEDLSDHAADFFPAQSHW